MLFTEPSFLFLFLPLLLGLYFLPFRAHRNVLLLAASVVFYAKGGSRFTFLIAASIVFNYVMAIAVHRRAGSTAGRLLLAAAVGVDLAVLAVFKYAAFIVWNVNVAARALRFGPWALPEIVLPIGISFFTFHAISYVVDVYRGDADAQKSPVEAALYLLLFPQLIAGPIIRYREIAAQLSRRLVTSEGFAGGAMRFTAGLAKKVLIANAVAAPADAIYALPMAQVSGSLAWTAALCYTLQIYFDFSGYSDMAIGLGAMFGFRFPENFNHPYIASSIQDFWRRWHMSLSRWFRDYVYVPLGGNRVSPGRTYINLVAVFFLCGLWHGASWSFVVWGLYHGAFLVFERVTGFPRRDNLTAGRRAWAAHMLDHAYVMLAVVVGWVFFRAETLSQALGMLRAMGGFAHATPGPYGLAWYLDRQTLITIAVGCVASAPVARILRPRNDALAWTLSRSAAIVVLMTLCVLFIAGRAYNPFIYFRF